MALCKFKTWGVWLPSRLCVLPWRAGSSLLPLDPQLPGSRAGAGCHLPLSLGATELGCSQCRGDSPCPRGGIPSSPRRGCARPDTSTGIAPIPDCWESRAVLIPSSVAYFEAGYSILDFICTLPQLSPGPCFFPVQFSCSIFLLR